MPDSASQTVIYKPLVVHEKKDHQKELAINELSNYLVYNRSIVWGWYI